MNKAKKLAVGAVTVMLLGACNGWPDTLPYDQALNQPEKYPTYAATAGRPVEFYAGNHRYMVMPSEVSLRSARTAAVSAGSGVSVFSLQGDEPPFASLYARSADGRTHAVAPID
jgi:hypothetical protein